MDELQAEEYRQLYMIVKYHIDKNVTTPKTIKGNILKLLGNIKNVALKLLINYVAYTGMAASRLSLLFLSFHGMHFSNRIQK